MITKKCLTCGEEFETDKPQKKTCSDECKKQREKEYQKSWQRIHKFRQREWMKEYYKRNSDKIKASNRAYDLANREEVLRKGRAYWKRYYQNNKEKIKKAHRRGYKNGV